MQKKNRYLVLNTIQHEDRLWAPGEIIETTDELHSDGPVGGPNPALKRLDDEPKDKE
jgi:hypothetical protein